MKRRVANSVEELIKHWNDDLIHEVDKNGKPLSYHGIKDASFNSININFDLKLPFAKELRNKMIGYTEVNPIIFNNCRFINVHIDDWNKDIKFINKCSFKNKLTSSGFNSNLTFDDGTIKNLDFENAIFGNEKSNINKKGKVRFHNCNLHNVNFTNTTFNSLADFWHSTFHKKVIFYKTDFLDTTVFSGVTFKKNVLFTYTTISKNLILKATKPIRGFDISIAIITGKILAYDFKVSDFVSESKIYKTAKEYDEDVSDLGIIPIRNKRETYRILKKHHESEGNTIESLPFKVLENKTLFKESINNLFKGYFLFFKSLSDLWVLFWNLISNWFGKSYFLGAVFTVFIGLLFFNLSIMFTTEKFEYAFSLDSYVMKNGIKDFLNFMNPTHKFDYLGENILKNEQTQYWFFISDFVGRLFIGYGVYQTIQAFRKYR